METLDSAARIEKINESLKKDYLTELIVPRGGIQNAAYNLLKARGTRPLSYDVTAFNRAGQQVKALPQFRGGENVIRQKLAAAGFNVTGVKTRPSSRSEYQEDLQRRMARRRAQLGIQPKDFTQQQRDVALLTGNKSPQEMQRFAKQYDQYKAEQKAQRSQYIKKGVLGALKVGLGTIPAAATIGALAPIATVGLAPMAAMGVAGYYGTKLAASGLTDIRRSVAGNIDIFRQSLHSTPISAPGLNKRNQAQKAALVSRQAQLRGLRGKALVDIQNDPRVDQSRMASDPKYAQMVKDMAQGGQLSRDISWATSVGKDIASKRAGIITKRIQDVSSGKVVPRGGPIAGISPDPQVYPRSASIITADIYYPKMKDDQGDVFQTPSTMRGGQVSRAYQFKSALGHPDAKISGQDELDQMRAVQLRRLGAGFKALTDPKRIAAGLMRGLPSTAFSDKMRSAAAVVSSPERSEITPATSSVPIGTPSASVRTLTPEQKLRRQSAGRLGRGVSPSSVADPASTQENQFNTQLRAFTSIPQSSVGR